MSFVVNTVLMHRRPHIDEVFAYFLALVFGKKVFAGIEKAKFDFIDAGSLTYNGMDAAKAAQNGILALGVLGGEFDEHPVGEDSERVKDHCVATLMAEHLGLFENLAFGPMIAHVLGNDLSGTNSGPLDLSRAINEMHRLWPGRDEKVVRWAMPAFYALYERQRSYAVEAPKELERSVSDQITLPNGTKLILIISRSDNELLGAYARKNKIGAVLLQLNSFGQMVIHSNPVANLNMAEVACLLRQSEAARQNRPITDDPLRLRGEGRLGDKIWHVFCDRGGRILKIMNGSLTAPGAEATALSVEEVRAIIKQGLALAYPVRYETVLAP